MSDTDKKNGSNPTNCLTPYHWERNALAMKAIEEMKKNPSTLEEKKAQVKMLNNQSWKNRVDGQGKKD